MAHLNEYFPEEVLHPSITLNEKLDEMGMGKKEFAIRTGKPEKTIIAVLKGESSITPDMAVQFENITKIPAKFWINKQSRFNEYKARLKRKLDIVNAEEWTRSFPYSDMAKLGWVPKTRLIEEKTINLFEYFAISNHDAWNKLYIERELKIAAYTSLKHIHKPHSISAWLRMGEIQAANLISPDFDKSKFKSNLSKIKNIMAQHPSDFFNQMKMLCLEAGVKLFYTPNIPNAPISGSTRWINDTPIIQLSARYRQNDRFWFTFFHEAGHILLHGKKYISLENIDFSDADQTKEEEAHEFAMEWTFTKKQEEDVLNSVPLSEQDIIQYAKKFNTHPALIIGRFHHKKILPYSLGREFIEPIDLSDTSDS